MYLYLPELLPWFHVGYGRWGIYQEKRAQRFSAEMNAEDQTDSYYMICPYCGYEHDVEPESYAPGTAIRFCRNCGRKFFYTTNMVVSHDTSGDCELNDEEHDWDTRKGGYRVCKKCGKVETL